jgi:hypothetical protein
MRAEHRAIRTHLSPSDCASRLRPLIASRWNPWSRNTFSGHVSEESFWLTDGRPSGFMRIVMKGQIRQDGAGTILEFQVGPDIPMLILSALAFLISAGYFAGSIYKIPIFGHILPAIPVRQGSNTLQVRAVPFLLIAAPLILFLTGRMSLQRRKKALIRNLIRSIDARVAIQEAA